MLTKKEILSELAEALEAGALTKRDIEAVMQQEPSLASDSQNSRTSSKSDLVARSLFYSAGVIMFAAVVSVINQTWGAGLWLHLMLTVGLGSIAWLAAYYTGQDRGRGEIWQGLSDALVLTGSLLLVAGGYIVINHFGNYSRVDFFEAVPALAALSGLHFAFYRLLGRDLVYLLGVLLAVSAVGAVVYGILEDSSMVIDIWAVVLIGLAGLLAWSTRVVSALSISTRHMHSSYDRFAIFMALFTMFLISFGDYAMLWYIALAVSICAVYYLSIISRQKILLGAASTFLILTTIAIAFRYFSGFSLTASLLVSAAGILSVAALATQINKRYLLS